MAHALGHLAALFLAPGHQRQVRGACPRNLHGHGAPRAAGPQHHHALTLQRSHLGDGLHHALAVVVVADQPSITHGDVVGGADRAHVIVKLVEERHHRHLPRHRDAHAAVAERPQRGDRECEVALVGDVVLPELPVQAMVRVHRIKHPVDRVLRNRVAEHAGHLLLWGDRVHGQIPGCCGRETQIRRDGGGH